MTISPRMNGTDQSTTDGFREPALIVKSDSVDNVRVNAVVIIVLTAGTVSILFQNAVTLAFGSLAAGTLIPCQGAKRVNLTGSTATVAEGI